MWNLAAFGLGAWVLSFIMLILLVGAAMTNASSIWGNMRLANFVYLDPNNRNSLIGFEKVVDYLVHIPLYAFLLIVGVLIFALHGLYGSKQAHPRTRRTGR